MDDDRLARGWTKTKLAAEAGLTLQTVSAFLNGHRHAPRVAKALAHALGNTTARYLIRADAA